jgi:hypothetical protein
VLGGFFEPPEETAMMIMSTTITAGKITLFFRYQGRSALARAFAAFASALAFFAMSLT